MKQRGDDPLEKTTTVPLNEMKDMSIDQKRDATDKAKAPSDPKSDHLVKKKDPLDKKKSSHRK